MVTFIDEWRRKFPSCMVVKRLTNIYWDLVDGAYKKKYHRPHIISISIIIELV